MPRKQEVILERNEQLREFEANDMDEIIRMVEQLVNEKTDFWLYPKASQVRDIIADRMSKVKLSKSKKDKLNERIKKNIHEKGQRVKINMRPLWEMLDLCLQALWVKMDLLGIPTADMKERTGRLIEIKSIEKAIRNNDIALLSSAFPAYKAVSEKKDVIHELQRIQVKLQSLEHPDSNGVNTLAEKGAGKVLQEEIESLFEVSDLQVSYSNRILNVGTGAALSILKKLIANIEKPVPFGELDDNTEPHEASEKIRGAIKTIRKELKNKDIPLFVKNYRQEAYALLLKTE